MLRRKGHFFINCNTQEIVNSFPLTRVHWTILNTVSVVNESLTSSLVRLNASKGITQHQMSTARFEPATFLFLVMAH